MSAEQLCLPAKYDRGLGSRAIDLLSNSEKIWKSVAEKDKVIKKSNAGLFADDTPVAYQGNNQWANTTLNELRVGGLRYPNSLPTVELGVIPGAYRIGFLHPVRPGGPASVDYFNSYCSFYCQDQVIPVGDPVNLSLYYNLSSDDITQPSGTQFATSLATRYSVSITASLSIALDVSAINIRLLQDGTVPTKSLTLNTNIATTYETQLSLNGIITVYGPATFAVSITNSSGGDLTVHLMTVNFILV